MKHKLTIVFIFIQIVCGCVFAWVSHYYNVPFAPMFITALMGALSVEAYFTIRNIQIAYKHWEDMENGDKEHDQ